MDAVSRPPLGTCAWCGHTAYRRIQIAPARKLVGGYSAPTIVAVCDLHADQFRPEVDDEG